MAVPEQTPYIEHTGNGSTTSFSLGFKCETKDHLIVLIDDIEPPIATWSLNSGNVVFTTAPAAGKKIILQRNTPFSRSAEYQLYNNSFRPSNVNADFDRIWWKLQELGVADWLLKLYVNRLHQQQEEKINNLKVYVDDRDDELRAYLMEEIRKQGVALDQLDDYYNYLMQRLAQIAVDKGWDSSFVTYNSITQKQFNDSISFFITPEMFGATGQNLEKDQAAFNSMIALGPGQTWQLKSGREYHVTNVTPPANTIIYANWAKLKKSSNDNQNVLNLYNHYTKVYNIEVDGNKSGTNTTGFGIRSLGSFNDVHGFYVHDAGRYGVVFANCENSTIKNGRSNNNGVWAVDGSTQADGIYFSNTKNCVAENCLTTGNGRTGLVQTSYADGHIKPELCHNNSFINCQSSDNAYSDVNTEGVSKPTFKNLVIKGGITFSRTNNAYLDDIDCGALYATETVRPTVKKIKITHRGVRNFTDNFFISGQDITVKTVNIDNTLAPTLAGSSFQIVDSGTLSVDTVNINRAATGVNISAASTELLQNINVGTATNKYRYNSTNYTTLPIIVSRTKIPTALDEAILIDGTGITTDANTFENGTFYNVDTGGAGTYINFPANFGDRYLTIETKAQSGVRSYQIARSLFVNTVMYRVKTAASTWTEWAFLTPRKATSTYNPPSLAAGESVETTLTMPGVTMSDTVVASFSQFHKDINVQGRVSAANTVSVVFHNHGTTPIDLGSGTISLKLI